MVGVGGGEGGCACQLRKGAHPGIMTSSPRRESTDTTSALMPPVPLPIPPLPSFRSRSQNLQQETLPPSRDPNASPSPSVIRSGALYRGTNPNCLACFSQMFHLVSEL